MYEIHVPAWGNDSYVGRRPSLKTAKALAEERSQQQLCHIWRTYSFHIFGWAVNITKIVWRSQT